MIFPKTHNRASKFLRISNERAFKNSLHNVSNYKKECRTTYFTRILISFTK